MKLIKQPANDFVCGYGRSLNGEIVGVVWMTATMRRVF